MVTHPDTPRSMGDHHAAHTSAVTPAEDFRTVLINKVSWGAVVAGCVVSLVTMLVLNLLGAGIGLSTINPADGSVPSLETAGYSIAIWAMLAGVIAAFLGGFASGRLSGKPKASTAGWNGLVTWAVTTLVVAYLATSSAGALLGGTMRTVAALAGGTTTAVAAGTAATASSPEATGAVDNAMRQQLGVTLPQTGTVQQAMADAAKAVVTGDQAAIDAAKAHAADALVQAQGITYDQAMAQVNSAIAQTDATVAQVKQQAPRVTQDAAQGAANAALLAVVAMVLAAVASWFGGRAGSVEPTVTAAGLAYTGPLATRRTTVVTA